MSPDCPLNGPGSHAALRATLGPFAMLNSRYDTLGANELAAAIVANLVADNLHIAINDRVDPGCRSCWSE
jgi:hypothetical protein